MQKGERFETGRLVLRSEQRSNLLLGHHGLRWMTCCSVYVGGEVDVFDYLSKTQDECQHSTRAGEETRLREDTYQMQRHLYSLTETSSVYSSVDSGRMYRDSKWDFAY